MDVREVERRCCVVKVSEAFSAKKPISCSGVIVHPHTGVLICTGLPFSRFLAHGVPLSPDTDTSFLPPSSLKDKLKISVCFSLGTNTSSETVTAPRSKTQRHQLRELPARLLMLVNCLEFKEAFQEVFQESEQWRFQGNEKDADLIRDASFLSWFAVLKVDSVEKKISPDSRGSIPWRSTSVLQKGLSVVACGSPFGTICLDLFISTLSRGIISNLAGEDNAVILTDARCLPGTEGGGLFLLDGSDNVHLIGLIVSPFGWKSNEWIGLSLVCSVSSIFRNILRCWKNQDSFPEDLLNGGETGLDMISTAQELKPVKYPTVCFVHSGRFWGSGVVVSSNLVLTCRHVVCGKPTVALKFHHRNR